MLKNSLKILKSKQKDTNSPSSRKKSLSCKRQKSKDPLAKPLENTEPRKILSKKPPLFKKPSIDLQKPSTPKTPKYSKPKLFAQTVLQGHNPSEIEKSCKIFDKNRARSNLEHSLKTKLDLSQKILTVKNTSPNRVDHIIKLSLRKGRRDRILKEKQIKEKRLQDEIKKLENNYQNNLIRKINKQKFKVKKLSPEGNSFGGRGNRKDMFKALQGPTKGTSRSVSTKRNDGSKKHKISVIEKFNPIPVQETYRRKSLMDQQYDEDLHPSKTEKIKILRNISLFENSEIPSINTPDQIFQKPSNNLNEITVKKPINKVNSQNILKKLRKLKENRAAKIIQRAFVAYMERKREALKTEQKKNKLKEIVQEQLGWREAQLVSLEYLKIKELEDLESVLQLFGENKQLKEFLFDVVNKRFNEFTKVFKENLENTEQAIIEDLDTLEVLDFSNKIKDKKDFVGKIIEGVNLNTSLSKNEVESLLKEAKDEVFKHSFTSTSCQTSSSIIKQTKKVEEVKILDEEIKELGEGKCKKNSNFSAPNTSPKFFKKKKKLKILSEVQDFSLEQFSTNDALLFDQDLASPIFKNPSDSLPRLPNCTSPIPDRPSAPLMFLDTDDNICLESLLNISTPLNKKSPQNLPLLNLGKLPNFSLNIPISSDPRIETSAVFIKNFISGVFSTIDKSQLAQEISKGITKDPLKELEKMREIDLGSFIEKNEKPNILNIKKLVENFLDDLEEVQTTQRFVNKADKIHKIMLLSVTDEILQKFRPYGTRGVPVVWSERTRTVNEIRVDIEGVVEKTLNEIEDFCLFEIGKIATDEMTLTNGRVDEELLVEIREDALGNAISKDIVESEWQWTDYEFEETQVKIDLADMVLDELTEEMLNLGL